MRAYAVILLAVPSAMLICTSATADTDTGRRDLGRMVYTPPDDKLVLIPYRVADIIASKAMTRDEAGQLRPGEEALIELITSKIAWKSWSCHAGGAKGTIDYFPLRGVLLINQTPEVHQRIEQRLRQLRKEAARER